MLQQTANDLSRGLPRMVDDNTELTSVEASESLISYHHRLVNQRAEGFEPSHLDTLRREIVESACNNPKWRETFAASGVALRWAYHDRDGRFIAAVEVTPQDCGY